MFLIKQIIINNLEENIKVIDGIRCVYVNGRYVAIEAFWGKSEIIVGNYADKTLFKRDKEEEDVEIIPYASECMIKDLDDGWKNLCFNISTYQLEKLEGYIIIVKYSSSIETDGDILFRRYPTEVVVKLTNDNYIKLGTKRFEVINNKLCLIL